MARISSDKDDNLAKEYRSLSKFLQTSVKIRRFFGGKFEPILSLINANASAHHGDSFEVPFMPKIGEISQEKVSRRRKSRSRK